MPEGSSYQFKLDKTNLIKAARIPLLVAAIGGALWLLGGLGGLLGVVFWIVAAYAGYWYANLLLRSGAKPALVDVAINGAILGAAVGIVYAVVSWIAISIRYPGLGAIAYNWGAGAVVRSLIYGGIGGAVGAAGWFAYKSGMIKTQ